MGPMKMHIAMDFLNVPPQELKNTTLVVAFQGNEWGMKLSLLDTHQKEITGTAIFMGIRLGICIIMSMMLFFIGRSYRSALFIMYQINFLLLFLGSCLYMAFLESFANSVTAFVLPAIPLNANKRLDVADSVLNTLVIFSLLATLNFQIWVAFSDIQYRKRIALNALVALGCFPCCFIWLFKLIISSLYMFHPEKAQYNEYGDIKSFRGIYNGTAPSFAATTSVCSAILCVKLILACRKRAQLGIESINPFKIILLMSLQNSVIPSVIMIVGASSKRIPDVVRSSAVLVTAVLLPVGYIWSQVFSYKKNLGLVGTTVDPISSGSSIGENSSFGEPSSPSSAEESRTYQEKSLAKTLLLS